MKAEGSIPPKPRACSKCDDTFIDGYPAALIREWDPDDNWRFTWVCRLCLASNWKYS